MRQKVNEAREPLSSSVFAPEERDLPAAREERRGQRGARGEDREEPALPRDLRFGPAPSACH